MGYAIDAAGALVRWVAGVMTPDLRGRRHAGLGPTGAWLQTAVSFFVVWLITFRIAGVTVGTVVAPWYGVIVSVPSYVAALIVGWLVLIVMNPTGSRREMAHRLTKALPAVGLVFGLMALLLVLVDQGNGWISSVAGEGADGGDIGRILLGLVFAIGVLIAFLALTIALLASLWYGAQNRFCAAAVHPLLPATVDLVMAAILAGSATVAVVRGSGSGSDLLVDLASAGVLIGFAGFDLVLLARPESPPTTGPSSGASRRRRRRTP